jgi:hypothetical protein
MGEDTECFEDGLSILGSDESDFKWFGGSSLSSWSVTIDSSFLRIPLREPDVTSLVEFHESALMGEPTKFFEGCCRLSKLGTEASALMC